MQPNLAAAPFYLIVRRHKLGWFFLERDVAATNRHDTINEIVGDPTDVSMVIELEAEANGEGGRWRDATSDLMAEIADRAASDGESISTELRDLIQTHAGMDHARGLRVHDRSFAAA